MIGGHSGATIGAHLDLRVGVEQYLHKLLDDAMLSELLRVQLVGAKVAHKAQDRFDHRPGTRLHAHELRDYVESIDGAHLLLCEQHVTVTVRDVSQCAHTRLHQLRLLQRHVRVNDLQQYLYAVRGQRSLFIILIVACQVGEDAGRQCAHCKVSCG